jgi:hypothetical protein
MRIPETVKIGPYDYAVVYEDNLRADDDCRLLGQADHMALTIRLRSEQLPQITQETFLHEVLHCIEHVYGMNLKEREINLFSVGLFAALRDNQLLREDEAA